MNSLAACYGYVSKPWVNFDQNSLDINYYHPTVVREALLTLAERPMANIVKSHHPAEFFRGELADSTNATASLSSAETRSRSWFPTGGSSIASAGTRGRRQRTEFLSPAPSRAVG